ncbi:DUF2612 domain-containing protein [Desulfovibrio psychrotolerans]|uniref:DUF2612 domain-containing protein n=1 Tax=Desulfovibrio psychrotolerans TaxID=415242 RepID=A0A7J0BWB8_9BACT|nr:DUF2612 domain-containing protein [Desulfovibrio psychrotolerans]GFM38010.1 hypothetical protein DSM19430T_26940 [Desulfovibrio psychrotolerans]
MAISDYLALISSQHRHRPKFMAVMEAILAPLCGIDNVLQEMRCAFDLDSAVGVQLDKTGEWIGRSRRLSVPLTDVYFSWDADTVGWGQGVWKGPYDPASGMVSLPDDAYRNLLRAKVAANDWDGTIPGAYTIWGAAFAATGSIILIQDNQDMSMVVGIAGVPPDAVMCQLLLQGYIPLKPQGVRVAYFAVTPSTDPDAAALFAWDCDSAGLAGWGTGNFPQILYPS